MKKVVFNALAICGLAVSQMSYSEQGFVDDVNVTGMMTTPVQLPFKASMCGKYIKVYSLSNKVTL